MLGKEVKGWKRVPGLSGLHVNLAELEDGIYLVQAHGPRRRAHQPSAVEALIS